MVRLNKEIALDNQVVLKNLADYTDEEQVIGTWLGKPLYRKKYNYIISSTEELDTNVEVADINTDIIQVRNLYGYLQNSNFSWVAHIPYNYPRTECCSFYYK